VFFKSLKNLSEENKSLNQALLQLKDLFIESLVEKDQDINFLKMELEEKERKSFFEENLLEEMKNQNRNQALEFEQKEDFLNKQLESLKNKLEEGFTSKLFEEIHKNEEKERAFFEEYRDLEDKSRLFEEKYKEKQIEIDALLKEKAVLNKEIEWLNQGIKGFERKIEEIEIIRKNNIFEVIKKENLMKKALEEEKEKNLNKEKNFMEISKKMMNLETKNQLFLLKDEKKKQKIREERKKNKENMFLFKEELEEMRKKQEEITKEWLFEKKELNLEISMLKEEKVQSFFKKYKGNSLGEEFLAMESSKKTIFTKDPKDLFERIGGKEISKSKISEFEDIVDKFRRNLWGNEELFEDFEIFIEDLKKILERNVMEIGDLKKKIEENEKGKELYKGQLEEILKKFDEKEEKKKENKLFGFGIPFFRR